VGFEECLSGGIGYWVCLERGKCFLLLYHELGLLHGTLEVMGIVVIISSCFWSAVWSRSEVRALMRCHVTNLD